MKKIFIISMMLAAALNAKILTANTGGECFPSSKVKGGYTECHAINVKYKLETGSIKTDGNYADSNVTFMIRFWDADSMRLNFVASGLSVNKVYADSEYIVPKEIARQAKYLDIVIHNDNFNEYKEEYKCWDDDDVPWEVYDGDDIWRVKRVICAPSDTFFHNYAIDITYNHYRILSKFKQNEILKSANKQYNKSLIFPIKTIRTDEEVEAICPKGSDIYYDENGTYTGYCIAVNCPKNVRYDYESHQCIFLDSGYIWLNNDKNDLSQRPACKAENERYNENTNQCEYKIENSHWIGKTLEYECNEGYVYINDLCEEKVSCNVDERYYKENNSCISKPENSHWNHDNDIIWTCDSGYVEIAGRCEVKRVCNENQKYVESDNWCVDPPVNGSWNYRGDIVCNDGYVKNGLLCEQKADCEHWNSENNTCFEKPIHSHWVYSEGATWECDAGYHSDTENKYCFKCEGETQFNYSMNTCVTKPENSQWTSEGIWHCNEGFFETEYGCEEIKECGFFERYDSYTNECIDKPSDSHWTADNSTNWECDDGYYKTYYDKCEKSNPIDLTNYISFAHDLTFGIGVGSGKDQTDNSTTIFNAEANYNIGAKIGNEFFNVRTQFSAGLFYTEFEYSGYIYMDETVNSIAFTFGPNIGFDFWKFSFDYSYIWRCGERLESITFNDTYSKYKFGFNINEHFNVNIAMIYNMISSTQRLKEFDDNMFLLGLTYRF